MNEQRENRNTNGENTHTKQTNERTNNQRQSPKPDSKQSGALLLLNFTLERVWRNTLTQNKNQLLSISSFLLLLAVFDLSKYNKTSDTCCSKTKRRKNNRHTRIRNNAADNVNDERTTMNSC